VGLQTGAALKPDVSAVTAAVMNDHLSMGWKHSAAAAEFANGLGGGVGGGGGEGDGVGGVGRETAVAFSSGCSKSKGRFVPGERTRAEGCSPRGGQADGVIQRATQGRPDEARGPTLPLPQNSRHPLP
jgi:hypothetical protein